MFLFACFCFIMTKLTAALVAKVQQFSEFKKCSINFAAKHFKLDWHTCRTALHDDRHPVKRQVLAKRKVKHAIVLRRGFVKKLALRVRRKAQHEFAVFPSVRAIRAELEKLGVVASSWAVRRDLHAMGFVSRVRRKVPTRDPETHRKRYIFADEMLRRPLSYLERIVFSDEHICSTNDYSHRRQWVRNSDRLLTRERKRVQNVPNVMIWGAIGVGYKSPVVLFPKKNEEDQAWRMNAAGYVSRCLSKVASGLESRVFQHDGARVHNASQVARYLEGKGISVVQNWPPYSPDLNCIEQLWPLLNRKIGEQHPTSLNELCAAVRTAWDALSQGEIDGLCRSFKTKLERCRQQRGAC